MLGGKCKYCGAKYHWHHLLVELITPLLFIMVYWRYGLYSILFFKYLVLTAFLIPIFFIDLFDKLILHVTTLPLIVLGLVFSLLKGTDVSMFNALISGGFAFGLLMTLAWLYSRIKKSVGLGGGDVMLLTAVTIFFGALNAPYILFVSSVLAVLYFLVFIRKADVQFVFGPFIAITAIFWFMVGEDLLELLIRMIV